VHTITTCRDAVQPLVEVKLLVETDAGVGRRPLVRPTHTDPLPLDPSKDLAHLAFLDHHPGRR
jgi:hypothetical protein